MKTLKFTYCKNYTNDLEIRLSNIWEHINASDNVYQYLKMKKSLETWAKNMDLI